MGDIMRELLIALSGISIGVCLYTVLEAIYGLVRRRAKNRREVKYLWSIIMSRMGYGVTTGLVMLRILFPAPDIPLNADSAEYAAGLALAAVGFLGMARYGRIADIFTKQEKQQNLDQKEQEHHANVHADLQNAYDKRHAKGRE